MNHRRITSVDVARAAGVSQSAVSRTYTPGASVSLYTRERVLEAARRLGYKPDALARGMATGRSRIIGLVMGEVANPFYPQVLERFSLRLQAMDRRVLLFTVPPGHDVDEALPQVMQYQVDGLVITSATLSSAMAGECRRAGIPVVLFNRYVPGAVANAVCCDNVAGGRLAADLLLDAGHGRLAVIAGVADTSTNVDRLRGFYGRLAERGTRAVLSDGGDYTYRGGAQAAQRLLSREDPPDAIFCANDIMALGALDAARHGLKLRVPEELSILGFDDIPAAGWAAYRLTTIRQEIDRMIDATLEILRAQLDDAEHEPVLRLVPGRLVVRASARLAGGATP